MSLDFVADGEWREYSVPFRVSGFLGVIGLDLGAVEGLLEFDWIRLVRRTKAAPQIVEQWNFAS